MALLAWRCVCGRPWGVWLCFRCLLFCRRLFTLSGRFLSGWRCDSSSAYSRFLSFVRSYVSRGFWGWSGNFRFCMRFDLCGSGSCGFFIRFFLSAALGATCRRYDFCLDLFCSHHFFLDHDYHFFLFGALVSLRRCNWLNRLLLRGLLCLFYQMDFLRVFVCAICHIVPLFILPFVNLKAQRHST